MTFFKLAWYQPHIADGLLRDGIDPGPYLAQKAFPTIVEWVKCFTPHAQFVVDSHSESSETPLYLYFNDESDAILFRLAWGESMVASADF